MKRAFPVLIKLLLLVLLAGVLVATNDLFLMVGSSANISRVAAPSVAVQIGSFAICAICLLLPVKKGARLFLYLVAIIAALLGGHRLLVDNFNNRISDIYLGVPIQRHSFNPDAQGGLSIHPVFGGFEIGSGSNQRSLRVVSPAGVGLEKAKLDALTSPQT